MEIVSKYSNLVCLIDLYSVSYKVRQIETLFIQILTPRGYPARLVDSYSEISTSRTTKTLPESNQK